MPVTATATKPPGPWQRAPRKVRGSLQELIIPLGGCWGHNGLYCIIGAFAHVQGYIRWRYGDESLAHNPVEPKGRCYGYDHHDPVIWLPRWPETPGEHATLAHETFHAVHKIAGKLGATLSSESQEFYAYAIGHIVDTILENGNASQVGKPKKGRRPRARHAA